MKQYNQSIRGKLFDYFKGRLNIKQSTKGWWRCNCIECGGKFTMGIHLEESKVHCFKCPMDLTPLGALMAMEDFDTQAQALDFLSIQQEYDYYEAQTRRKDIILKPIELPDSFQLLNQGDNIMARAARYRMKKRGYNIDRLSLKGIGYCTRGTYAGYLIFPFYRKGKLVYFQSRLFMGSGPKMKNPPEEEYGIGKSQLIYNQDALYIYDKIYWVESITNAETIGDQACAGLGKSVSPWQMSHLIMSPCKKLVILLDDDAYDDAIKLSMQLVNYKEVKLVRMPEKQDVNDLGKKPTMELVRAEKYTTYNDLFRLKLNHGQAGSQPPHYGRGPYQNHTRG